MELREVAGEANGTGLRIGIVVSDFNAVITDALLEGALQALGETGVAEATVVRVPGALELPLAAQRLAADCHAVVAIGAVIAGETDHYHHVATQTAAGLSRAALTTGVPITNGVLTVREFSQARERSLPGPANKGFEAARAAIVTANALRALD